MLGRLRVIAVLVCLSLPYALAAQAADAVNAGPTLQSSVTAFRPNDVPRDVPRNEVRDVPRNDFRNVSQPAVDSLSVAMQRRGDVSKPVAIMIVGGAAIVLGAVVDNDVGDLIVIGGVVAVLYGLYQYLK